MSSALPLLVSEKSVFKDAYLTNTMFNQKKIHTKIRAKVLTCNTASTSSTRCSCASAMSFFSSTLSVVGSTVVDGCDCAVDGGQTRTVSQARCEP